MIRKFAFAVAATLALGSASLAVSTTPAAAWGGGWHGHHHHHFGGGFRFYGPRYVGGYAYDGCYRRRVVGTPWGPRVRLVNVCY